MWETLEATHFLLVSFSKQVLKAVISYQVSIYKDKLTPSSRATEVTASDCSLITK